MRGKWSVWKVLFGTAKYLYAVMIAVFCCFPFLWMLSTDRKSVV